MDSTASTTHRVGVASFFKPLSSVDEHGLVNLSLKEKAAINYYGYQQKMLPGYSDVDDFTKTRQQRMVRNLSTPRWLVTDQNGQPDVRSSDQTDLSFLAHWLEFQRQGYPRTTDRWRTSVADHIRSYLME